MSEVSSDRAVEGFMSQYYDVARLAKQENRRIFNQVCIRVDDIDAAEKLMEESFGITGFVRPAGKLFQGEQDLSVAWLNDEVYLELMEPTEPQELGYDTGCGHPIGHLSEIGFFVPDLDQEVERLAGLGWEVRDEISDLGARMVKVDTDPPSGFPVELIEVFFEDQEPGG
jgi:catechol 2,3-dioxygenase-like lactoylglutathione lyase family enzyme